MTDTAEARKWWDIVPHIILGIVALQLLLRLTVFHWAESTHIGLIAVGLACLLWRYAHQDEGTARPVRMQGILIALAVIFIVIVLDRSATGTGLPYGLSLEALTFLLIAVAFSISWWAEGFRRTLHWTDWLAIGCGLLVTSIAVVGSFRTGEGLAWGALAAILKSLLIWFAATWSIAARPKASNRLAICVVAPFVLVSLAGGVQAGAGLYHARKGDTARAGEHFREAADQYREAVSLTRRLGLKDRTAYMAYKLAGVLFAQGKEEGAAEALSLGKDFVMTVSADDWEGPEGGNLYYKVSCWQALELLPGEVEIRIYAQGTPAYGEWPEMRVRLADVVIEDVLVESREIALYVCSVRVKERGRQKLEIAFLNDYHQLNPYIDRNLMIHHAEVRYERIEWE